tara:strand:+ start:464 stop:628 length:165 start_codon:yes stop_codon:yes gene_type:complete
MFKVFILLRDMWGLKEKTAFVAIKYLRLRYESKDKSEAELFIKLIARFLFQVKV